jgi:hypothetical protein
MNISFGWKAHSGWAALVVIGRRDRDFVVVDRRRVELVDEEWAKQPYHAAEHMEADAARALVERGIDAAHQKAAAEMSAALAREKERRNVVCACAVLAGNPMPAAWSIAEILAVHFRMHKAEGVLFRDALIAAAKASELRLVVIAEKGLMSSAETALGMTERGLTQHVGVLGKAAGPPWGKDQKDAALAAMVGLIGV